MSSGQSAEKEKPEKESAPTYTVERLIEDSSGFLGYPSHVAAGAFYGTKKKTMTIMEAKKICDDFMKKPEDKGVAAEKEAKS